MCPCDTFRIWGEVRQGVCVVKIRVCQGCGSADILGIDNEWHPMKEQVVVGAVNEKSEPLK